MAEMCRNADKSAGQRKIFHIAGSKHEEGESTRSAWEDTQRPQTLSENVTRRLASLLHRIGQAPLLSKLVPVEASCAPHLPEGREDREVPAL